MHPTMRSNSEWRYSPHRDISVPFSSGSREACELGKQGTWAVDRIRSETDEFLRKFTIEAYYEKGHDRSGRKSRGMVSNENGSLLPEVKQEFQKSEEWHEFEEELLAVANPGMAPSTSTPAQSREWADIEISFLSDERVQVLSALCGDP
jgi:hypothetical protein